MDQRPSAESATTTLKAAAEAHIRAYAAIFAQYSNSPQAQVQGQDERDPHALAQAMTRLYTYPFTSFVLGKTYVVPTQEDMARDSTPYLASWIKAGLLRFRLKEGGVRVECLSPACAMCWITWEVPDDEVGEGKRKGWEWENVYVYRLRGEGGRGGFEATFADNEFLGLMEHAPEILGGLPGAGEMGGAA